MVDAAVDSMAVDGGVVGVADACVVLVDVVESALLTPLDLPTAYPTKSISAIKKSSTKALPPLLVSLDL
jgi:hypothetical protein